MNWWENGLKFEKWGEIMDCKRGNLMGFRVIRGVMGQKFATEMGLPQISKDYRGANLIGL